MKSAKYTVEMTVLELPYDIKDARMMNRSLCKSGRHFCMCSERTRRYASETEARRIRKRDIDCLALRTIGQNHPSELT